ncbi:hypothetical protein [Acidisphaera sp. S103]|uniref:hypothetical protein n=1 Tax=Acidisphaera sp. S103 TaxID=1747223 RepID=UPI00131B8E90|nr:hypothetical protein [Acidisphaera sp. S103]
MSLQDAFSRQIMAFHGAIMDNCDRAAGADRSDTMALRLRNNAVALAKMQLAMLALTKTEPAIPGAEGGAEPDVGPDEEPAESVLVEPEPMASDGEPVAFGGKRVLAGDALSRFVSRPLGAGESPHEVWRRELDNDPVRRRRNAVLPGAGFRSPSS